MLIFDSIQQNGWKFNKIGDTINYRLLNSAII